MKANEAPDKIYLQVCGDCPQTDCVTCKFDDLEGVTWNKDRIFPKDVEYTRTDAFIDKATLWLLTNASDYCILHNSYDTQELVKDFVEAMKRD